MLELNSNQESSKTAKSSSRSYQTGHAKNVYNFETLLNYVMAYGDHYNPAKEELKKEKLQELLALAFTQLSEVNLHLSAYTNAVTAREESFMGFDTFITNVYLTLKAFEPSKNVLDDAKSYVKKLKGKRVIPKVSVEEITALSENEKDVKYNSVAQLGYDTRVENFDRLIALLSTIPSYMPNEAHLSIDGLKAKYTEFKVKNIAVKEATTSLSNVRMARNKTLYLPETGLYSVATGVKSYVRAIFGLSSPQYKQIKNVKFTSFKFN
jgi:hypothetical protein